MKNLMKLAVECMRELDAIGVEYGDIVEWKTNSRAQSRWGCCTQKSTPWGTEYIIEINAVLLDDKLSDKIVKETIFHELAHSCKGCMNHGTNWKKIVDLINDCYGYNISRCTSAEEKGVSLERKPYKYNYHCSSCGVKVGKSRKSNFTDYYYEYGCRRCGAKKCWVCDDETDSRIVISSTYNFGW